MQSQIESNDVPRCVLPNGALAPRSVGKAARTKPCRMKEERKKSRTQGANGPRARAQETHIVLLGVTIPHGNQRRLTPSTPLPTYTLELSL